VPVCTLRYHAHLRPFFLRPCAHLRVLIYGSVSPFLHSLFSSRTSSLLCRLNSRDRIRTKLAAGAKDGIMITIPRFAAAKDPGGDGTGGVLINVVNSVMDQSIADSTSQKVKPS
jgi:hypothetical protein